MKKNIAIIGGGASGIISGYLLNLKYNVTVYEKEKNLGGNIRTLNKNAKNNNLREGLYIENGVLGFSQPYYPNFHKLLNHLNVPIYVSRPSINLFYYNNVYSNVNTSYLDRSIFWKIFSNPEYIKQAIGLKFSLDKFISNLKNTKTRSLIFKDYNFSTSILRYYTQALFMLSFSTPFNNVPEIPQRLLKKYFLSNLNSPKWSYIEGGVYNYIENMLSNSSIKIIRGAKNLQVFRGLNQIVIKLNGESKTYDKVIIATTPGEIKSILHDMDHLENSIFFDWDDRIFKTIAHKDVEIYNSYKNTRKTPMDLFHKFPHGYNTYMNEFCNLKTNTKYSYAYNLEKVIRNKNIIDKASHIVPIYNQNNEKKIKKMHDINGRKNTFFAGAYLSNGLHEGAINSAMKISKILGGIEL